MNRVGDGNLDQAKRWNGHAGMAWVELQALLDRMFEPFERILAEAAHACAPRTVLDVGCGTGATTLAIARRLGSSAACTGIDISETMITLARERADRERLPVQFVAGDVQVSKFAPGAYEMFVSRMGVMFFADPVQAFANLRKAAAPRAAMNCIVWRSAQENPFMTTAERALPGLLPALPARRPDEPGQFAFADPGRVEDILAQGGWMEFDIRPIDISCTMSEAELDRYAVMMGATGVALAQQPEDVRKEAAGVLRAAFSPFVHHGEARFDAACWQVTARAGQ